MLLLRFQKQRELVPGTSDAFQQNGSGFVVWVLRDEFAAEGFGEDRLRELLDVRFGFRVARYELIGQRKQRFYAAHDFVLFGEWRQTKHDRLHIPLIDAGLIDRVFRVLSKLKECHKTLKIQNRVFRLD